MLERQVEGELVTVTFRLPGVSGGSASVVGDFNDWSPEAHPMRREGDDFVATVSLRPGRVHRFRYLLDGNRWENDWAADTYVANDFGGHDSVLDLTASLPSR